MKIEEKIGTYFLSSIRDFDNRTGHTLMEWDAVLLIVKEYLLNNEAEGIPEDDKDDVFDEWLTNLIHNNGKRSRPQMDKSIDKIGGDNQDDSSTSIGLSEMGQGDSSEDSGYSPLFDQES